jgi:CubicO group peptidase (beta-lactamase class C family)
MATGYVGTSVGWREEPETVPGAFSPMGGLHSSVRDMTRWMGGFLNAFNAVEAPHPLAAKSRREQQQPYSFARLVLRTEPEVSASSLSYGYGLLVEEHSSLGRFVLHSGGYPGFGSHMRWHPATGYGVVALSNRTYAPMGLLVEQVGNALVADAEPLVPAVERMWPVTREAMDVAESLLCAWNDELADAWFAHNLDLDQARAERRDAVRDLAANFVTRDDCSVSSRSPAHARWEVRTERGDVLLELLMSPDREPRIQTLTYRSTAV